MHFIESITVLEGKIPIPRTRIFSIAHISFSFPRVLTKSTIFQIYKQACFLVLKLSYLSKHWVAVSFNRKLNPSWMMTPFKLQVSFSLTYDCPFLHHSNNLFVECICYLLIHHLITYYFFLMPYPHRQFFFPVCSWGC